jgi:DNA gyrase/topoisomerase IV subunit A
MKIADFINGGFKNYAKYHNDRSLPHLMDGFKVTQRKVVYAFVDHIGYSSIVCDKAGMRAADLSKYHHGAISMIGVLVGMNQDFAGSNNLPLFQKDGQFGTRLNHEASSERYISTKLNDTFKKMFDPDDNHILESLFDDGDKIEPKFYLPRLPMLLINGCNGTGNGYKSNVLNYEANEVRMAVQEVLKTGLVQNKLTPFMNGFIGGISKDHATGQVTYEGIIERKNSTTLIITELPPSMQLAKYKEVLNKLMEKVDGNSFIKDYDNESTEDAWRFVIDCPRSTTALTDVELLVKFKLIEKDTETLVAWLPNDKLKVFASVENLVETWVEYRLGFYETRRLNKIARYNIDLDWLNIKLAFIKWWNANASDLVKLTKQTLRDKIRKEITADDGFTDRLLSIRISNLGLDEVTLLMKEISQIEDLIGVMENTTNRKMMDMEIKNIKL